MYALALAFASRYTIRVASPDVPRFGKLSFRFNILMRLTNFCDLFWVHICGRRLDVGRRVGSMGIGNGSRSWIGINDNESIMFL